MHKANPKERGEFGLLRQNEAATELWCFLSIRSVETLAWPSEFFCVA